MEAGPRKNTRRILAAGEVKVCANCVQVSGLSGRKCVYYRAAEWVSYGQLPPAAHINSTHAQKPGSRQKQNKTWREEEEINLHSKK